MRKKLRKSRSRLTSLSLFLLFFVMGTGVVFGGGGSLLMMPEVSQLAEKDKENEVAVEVGAIEVPQVSIAPPQPAPVMAESTPEPKETWHMVESASIPVAPVDARSALVINDKTGEVLAAKNADQVVAMASITKLMTAWVALDRADMDYRIKVSSGAASTPPTHLPLVEGDVLTLGELLHAILLTSANDAAVAIKDGMGGQKFIDAMNAKASEMGLKNTHFANTTGFDAEGHHSTSTDLAKLAHHLFEEHPEMLTILQKKDQHYPANDDRKAYHMPNFHPLVDVYPGYMGGKPGFTGNAGMCLLTVAERNEQRVIAVVLNSPDMTNESIRLLDFGFEQIK